MSPTTMRYAAIFVIQAVLVARCSAQDQGRAGPLSDQGYMCAVSVSPSGDIVAVAGRYGRTYDGRLSLYAAKTGQAIGSFLWPDAQFVAVEFAPPGDTLAIADGAGEINVWGLSGGTRLEKPQLRLIHTVTLPARVNDIAFKPDGTVLAAGCVDHVVRLLGLRTGDTIGELRGHHDGVSAVRFSPDGQCLASGGGYDGTIKVWDVAQRSELLTLEHGQAGVNDLAFSPDGKSLVGAYGTKWGDLMDQPRPMEHPDEQVRVWDLQSGKLLRTFRVAGDRVNAVVFAGDGGWIAAASDQLSPDPSANFVAILSADSGERVATLRRPRSIPNGLAVFGKSLFALFYHYVVCWDLSETASPRLVWEHEWHWEDKLEPFVVSPATQPTHNVPASVPASESAQDQARAQLAARFTNSLGMDMVLIPPGEFMMGSPLTSAEVARRYGGVEGYYQDDRHHRVRITSPFYLAACEVTVAQFRRFVKDTSYQSDAEREGFAFVFGDPEEKGDKRPGAHWGNPGIEQGEDHPVVCISWDDAVAFCQWLSQREGRQYRLPTEAEWEYACRAGSQTEYWWGDQMDTTGRVANVADQGHWTRPEPLEEGLRLMPMDDGFKYTSPVGSYRANAFGLHDMIGNACEWCSDRYAPYEGPDQTDPSGPALGKYRILRGGSWLATPGYCRSASRYHLNPKHSWNVNGFRVASRTR